MSVHEQRGLSLPSVFGPATGASHLRDTLAKKRRIELQSN